MGSKRNLEAAVLFLLLSSAPSSCSQEDENKAKAMCAEAAALDETDPEEALLLRRKIWEEVPTTGTKNAKDCLRQVRERMGKVRSLVSHDTRGDEETVDGCEWAAHAVEVFSGSSNLPYRGHWARRLMERCVYVVGRAWARSPDDERLRELNERLKHLSKE